MQNPEQHELEITKLELSTLEADRLSVLKLPGAEKYVSDLKAPSQEIDTGLEKMVKELTNQLDAENMIHNLTFDLAWPDDKAKKWFAHPERRPYKSQVELTPQFTERRKQLLIIGTYLRSRYEHLHNLSPESEDSAKAAKNLRTFYEYSTYHLFADQVHALRDRINGIDPKDRSAGNIKPTAEILNLMRNATKKVAETSNLNPSELFEQMLKAIDGGNYGIIPSFLTNYQGSPELRRALETTSEERSKDSQLAIEQLKLLWEIESFRLEMGINLDMLYQINGFPEAQVIKNRLFHFLSRKDLVEEMWKHLETEAPKVAKKARTTGVPIDYWHMLQERARHHNFPNQPSSPQEIEAKKKRVWRKVAEILPLAFVESPTSLIEAPMQMGATRRPGNYTYRNKNNRVVDTFVVNPREEEVKFAESTGHEAGHKIHATILRAAEEAGFLAPNAWERLPDPLKEDIAQLAEDQIGKIFRQEKAMTDISPHEIQKSKFPGEWRGLWHAFLVRRQAPYALTQRAVRLMMEQIWQKGKKSQKLTQEKAKQIIKAIQPQIAQWYAEGVPMTAPTRTLLTEFSLLNPWDGLVYLNKFLTKPKLKVGKQAEVEKDESIDLKAAFAQRFGEIWLDNKENRAVLFALMAEMAKTEEVQDLSTYPEFIQKTDPDEAIKMLESWGINPSLI